MNTYFTGTEDVSESDVVRLKEAYGVSESDLEHVRALGLLVADKIESVVAEFYVWLETQPSWNVFFSEREKAKKLEKMQVKYWQMFFAANLDVEYISGRKKIGRIHAEIGLSLSAYFSAMSTFQDLFLKCNEDIATEQVLAMCRLIMLDTAITVETFNQVTNQFITDQSNAMLAMSTPVTAIWDDVLMLPIVGIVDSSRAQNIMDSMLGRIAEQQTKVFILDISSVSVIDTAVANHLIKMTKAAALMGCQCIISGISPSIAQTMVELGIDVGNIITTSNLKDALKSALSSTGFGLQPLQQED